MHYSIKPFLINLVRRKTQLAIDPSDTASGLIVSSYDIFVEVIDFTSLHRGNKCVNCLKVLT
jgi:hypothetical protein